MSKSEPERTHPKSIRVIRAIRLQTPITAQGSVRVKMCRYRTDATYLGNADGMGFILFQVIPPNDTLTDAVKRSGTAFGRAPGSTW